MSLEHPWHYCIGCVHMRLYTRTGYGSSWIAGVGMGARGLSVLAWELVDCWVLAKSAAIMHTALQNPMQ